ncbi:MAG: hypothetical protein ACYTDV_21480, partial [Planctomycetota bacterium]
MAARKRKKKGKTGAISSLLSVLKRKRKKRTSWVGPGLRAIVKVLAVVCLLSGAALGLLFLEEYVKDAAGMSQDAFYLELADVPAWVDAGLKNEVKEIANSGGVDVRSDDDAALAVRRNIEKQVAWLDDVTVRVKQDVLRVEGRWRKPVALIRTDLVEPRYVDSELV